MGDKKLSVEHTVHLQSDSYLEHHNEIGFQSPILA